MLEQALRLHVLEQVAVGAGAQDVDHVALVVGHGEHHDARVDSGLAQRAQGVQAVHALHVQVQQDHVRVQLGGQAQGFLAAAGLADHAEVVFQFEQLGDALAHHRMVVHQQQANRFVGGGWHVRHGVGSLAAEGCRAVGTKLKSTRVPWGARASKRNWLPRVWPRSCMMVSP